VSAIRAGLAYFALVLGAGFVLGVIRVLAIVPWTGERAAELLEMPVMAVVIVLAARAVTRRMAASTSGRLVAVGSIALALLVGAELAMVVLVRRSSVREYVAGRDPVSGGAFVAMLAIFALMPLVVGRRA